MVFLFFLGTILVVGNGSSGSGSGVSEISEKMVPSRGSVGSGSVSFPPSLGSAAAAAAAVVVVTAEAPMPESTTVDVTTATGDLGRTAATVDVKVGDLGRIGVEEKIGEPICVEVKEASDMELKIQFVSNTRMVAMRLTFSPWATVRPRRPRCRRLHHSLRENRISLLGGLTPVRGRLEGGLIRIMTGFMHGRRRW